MTNDQPCEGVTHNDLDCRAAGAKYADYCEPCRQAYVKRATKHLSGPSYVIRDGKTVNPYTGEELEL